MTDGALKSHGINVDLPDGMLDLDVKTSKMKEGNAKGEIEFKGRCLYSLRFVARGKGSVPWGHKPVMKERVTYKKNKGRLSCEEEGEDDEDSQGEEEVGPALDH